MSCSSSWEAHRSNNRISTWGRSSTLLLRFVFGFSICLIFLSYVQGIAAGQVGGNEIKDIETAEGFTPVDSFFYIRNERQCLALDPNSRPTDRTIRDKESSSSLTSSRVQVPMNEDVDIDKDVTSGARIGAEDNTRKEISGSKKDVSDIVSTFEEEPLADEVLSFEAWKVRQLATSEVQSDGEADNAHEGGERSEGHELDDSRTRWENQAEEIDASSHKDDMNVTKDGRSKNGASQKEEQVKPSQEGKKSPSSDSNGNIGTRSEKLPKDEATSSRSVHRYNYASPDCSARIHSSSPASQNPSSILHKSKDRYMLTPCSAKEHWVVIELCDEIRIDALEIGMFEFFSGVVKEFVVSVGGAEDDDDGEDEEEGEDVASGGKRRWEEVGRFTGRNVRGAQTFALPKPTRFQRFIRLDFPSFYGSEYYCPISSVKVFGMNQMEAFKWESRRNKIQHAKPIDTVSSNVAQSSASSSVTMSAASSVPSAASSTAASSAASSGTSLTITSAVYSMTSPASLLVPLSITSSSASLASSSGSSAAASSVPPAAPASSVSSSASSAPISSASYSTSSSCSSPHYPASSTGDVNNDIIPTVHQAASSTSSTSFHSKSSMEVEMAPGSTTPTDLSTAPALSATNSSVANASEDASKTSSTAAISSGPFTASEPVSPPITSSLSTVLSMATDSSGSAPAQQDVTGFSQPVSTSIVSSGSGSTSASTLSSSSGPRATAQLHRDQVRADSSESIYAFIIRRLTALEGNATLATMYMEAQNEVIRNVLRKQEKAFTEWKFQSEIRLRDSLARQREDSLTEFSMLLSRLEDIQLASDADTDALKGQLRSLADEITFEKRRGIVQLLVMLAILILGALSSSNFIRTLQTSIPRHRLSLSGRRRKIAPTHTSLASADQSILSNPDVPRPEVTFPASSPVRVVLQEPTISSVSQPNTPRPRSRLGSATPRSKDFDRPPYNPIRHRQRMSIVNSYLDPSKRLARHSHLHTIDADRLRQRIRTDVKSPSVMGASSAVPPHTSRWQDQDELWIPTDEDGVSASEAEDEVVKDI